MKNKENKKKHYNYNVNNNETTSEEKLFSAEKTPPLSVSTTDVKKNTVWRTFTIFVTGGIVGALIMSVWGVSPTIKTPSTTNKDNTKVTASVSGTSSTTAGSSSVSKKKGIATGSVVQSDTSGAVSVETQPAGNSVVVESVTVPPPGVWVAVQETQGNQLGNVLGATRVHGPLSNVVVNLLRNTKPNKTYAVVLYRDNGDNSSIFDLEIDSVYVDFDSGKRVVVPFRTTAVTATSAHI